MKIAVDFDGTITAHPGTIPSLMWVLGQNPDTTVFILTACAGELPLEFRQEEAEMRVKEFGLGAFPVVWCDTSDKIAYCAANQVDILIDDFPFPDTRGILQLIPNNETNIAIPNHA
jgi:hypothetical protein